MGSRDGRARVIGNDSESFGRNCKILGSMSSGVRVPWFNKKKIYAYKKTNRK
jgi:hypothetical protein